MTEKEKTLDRNAEDQEEINLDDFIQITEEDLSIIIALKLETNANGLGHLLGISRQRIYQLEKKGLFTRTESGYFNMADAIKAYDYYKDTGKIVSCSEENKPAGIFIDATEPLYFTDAQTAAILGTTPTMLAHCRELQEDKKEFLEYLE